MNWRIRTGSLSLDETVLMGIVNVTPDSFSDGGSFLDPDQAVAHARRLVDEGAHLVDVGGESTRPGAEPVPEAEELRRVIPVVRELAASGVRVSIDTRKPKVAEAALEAGAVVINDVSGLTDPAMRRLAAESGAGVVVMHMKGDPRTMQSQAVYTDVVAEVADFLRRRAEEAVAEGVHPEAVCVDPGIGFGKTTEHNLLLLRDLPAIVALGYPVLVGTSRKSFLGAITGRENPADRDLATAVTVALAVERGAHAVRVHDVAAAREAAAVAAAIVRAAP
ncbi:MAG: dihydropteroate synthase [Acidimicrobiia bacterium]|nr:MAG: dihydropteroate synthase [Acidimicrobiia bacterium]